MVIFSLPIGGSFEKLDASYDDNQANDGQD